MPSLQRLNVWSLAGLLVLACWPAPAAAANYYGAIAFSPDSGADGYSTNYSTQAGAEEKALQECGGNGCKVVLYFSNACGALAVGKGNGYGTGWSTNTGQAQTTAMTGCSANTTNCSIKRWQCTTMP